MLWAQGAEVPAGAAAFAAGAVACGLVALPHALQRLGSADQGHEASFAWLHALAGPRCTALAAGLPFAKIIWTKAHISLLAMVQSW